jgi:hypothetical protein
VSPDLKFAQELLPDDRKVTSQFSIHLPADTHTIVVTPTLSFANIANRPYRLSVEHKVNNTVPRPINPSPGQQKKREEPPYEVRLNPGSVNTIECTIVAPMMKSANGVSAGAGGGLGNWEMERFRVFVSLLPA